MGAASDSRIGQVLGGAYRVERLIGEGGMGSVYEAQHLRLPRRFAIKLLNPQVLGNASAFERFQREAEIASSLGHEHIVQVFDFNHTDDGVPFMALELLQGEDLSTRLARGRLSLAETAHFLQQTASALAAAHAGGIVHRDLNPRNVFLCRQGGRSDFVKVLDFGISKIVDPKRIPTVTGSIMGTPNYMSPEQAEGRQSDIDRRTDVFALGAILYECLTGQRAFEAPTLVGALYQVCHGTPVAMAALVPELPAAVETVIANAMKKSKAERTGTVSQLCDDFLVACASVHVVPDDAPTMMMSSEAVASAVADPAPALAKWGPHTTLGGSASEAALPSRGRRRRWPLALATAGLAGAAVIILLVATRHPGGNTADSVPVGAARPDPSPPEPAPTRPVAAPPAAATPAATAAPTSAPTAAPPTPAPTAGSELLKLPVRESPPFVPIKSKRPASDLLGGKPSKAKPSKPTAKKPQPAAPAKPEKPEKPRKDDLGPVEKTL